MPYIERKDRARAIMSPETPGELNYAVTELLLYYKEKKGLSYQTLNDIVGALECCKQEFIRRVVEPYEIQKCNLNGDCY
jgi:hypothetical protein